MATANINFTITKPSSGYDISSSILAPSETITKRETNRLNITLVGFSTPTSVSVDVTLPNGTIQKDLHLISSVDTPTLFYRVLNDIFTDVDVTQNAELIITRIVINDLGFSYETSEDTTFDIDVYATDTNITYTPTDLDVLFLENSKLKDRLLKLENTVDFIDLPKVPDTDGTYTLKCIVSNGVKTYTWITN